MEQHRCIEEYPGQYVPALEGAVCGEKADAYTRPPSYGDATILQGIGREKQRQQPGKVYLFEIRFCYPIRGKKKQEGIEKGDAEKSEAKAVKQRLIYGKHKDEPSLHVQRPWTIAGY